MHICISKLTTIGSDNGFLPVQSQAIIWTSAGIWLTGNLGTKFSEILIDILIFFYSGNVFESDMAAILSWPQ